MKYLVTTAALLICATAAADEVVSVASLDVKDRIQTMEQINVSAELEKQAEAPSSEAVAALLEEATKIELEDQE